MDTVQLLKSLVENHQILAYLVIFIGIIFEGEVVLICTGILINLGALDLMTAIFFIIFGGLLKTFSFYYLGQMIHRKWSQHRFLKYLERRVLHWMPHFNTKPFWSIFASKFIIGINYLVILFAGYVNISKKVFFKAELASTTVWATGLLSLGFFFSETALSISREISKFSLIVLLLLIAFFIFDKLISKAYEAFEEIHDIK